MPPDQTANQGLEFDSREFRRALGQFATGVTVVTTRDTDGTPRGFTANSFTSVSLDPPLVLVCIGKHAASLPIFENAPGFAITILAEQQRDVAGLFASQRADKFKVADWTSGKSDMPIVDGGLAWMECSRYQVVDAGDHIILIGRVMDFGYRDGPVLGYLRGSFFTLGLEDTLADAAGRDLNTVIGAVLERDGDVLLEEDTATGILSVPAVGRNTKSASLDNLKGRLAATGMQTSIDFVYAVFEDKKDPRLTVYYRGRVTGDAPEGWGYHPVSVDTIDRLNDGPSKIMLERYASEAAQGRFAVYMGDETEGVVHPLG